ncbi:MAG: GGDEF domain-containing protein [Nannocystis sp.]|nr:GGDEF domain-containing protein [Nannocystis sp.]
MRALGPVSAPASLRAVVAAAPSPVTVDLTLPATLGQVSAVGGQLVKLLATSACWRPGEVQVGEALRLECAAAGRRVALVVDGHEAAEALVARLFCGLFSEMEVFELGRRFAAANARLAALGVLTQHMLAAPDVDAASFMLLTGLTAGDGLGMNRAALFRYDEIRRRFVGARGVGPASLAEAHQIWENLEREGNPLELVLAGNPRRGPEGGFQALVYGAEVVLGEGDDEIALACASRGPLLFEGPAQSPALARLGATGPFFVGVLQPRDRPLALIFADNLFSRAPISADLMAAAATFLSQSALVWDNVALLRHVERLARYDSLTGLFNRREFEARMAVEETRCMRSRRPCALLLIDLDNFKQVNDEGGHAAGDAVLRELGELLRQTLRGHDLIGRFGGDEFTVLLVETPASEVTLVLRRIGKLAWERGIAMSIGVASFPSDCEVPSGLFALADKNLYAAKEAGRSRACVGAARVMVQLGGAEPRDEG